MAEAADNLSRITFTVVPTATALFSRIGDSGVAAIDISVELPVNRPRQCDLDARQMLKPEGARVFPTPARVALNGKSFEECCQLNEAALGTKLSLPAYGFLPEVREVDGSITPELQTRIREAHPETVFLALAGRVLSKKDSAEGHRERLDALLRHGVDLDVARALMHLGRGVAVDDILDAAACLLAAVPSTEARRRCSATGNWMLADGGWKSCGPARSSCEAT